VGILTGSTYMACNFYDEEEKTVDPPSPKKSQ
jgi:hypothetical protein